MANRRIHRHLIGAYVYALTVDGVDRYIGKGRKYRVVDHLSRIKAYATGSPHYGGRHIPAYIPLGAALSQGAVIDYRIILNSLSDDEAWLAERLLIQTYPDGQLWNAVAGGKGDTGGRRLRAIWNDPISRASLQKRIKEGHLDDRYRDQAKLTAIRQWKDPVHRAKWEASHRALWDNPILAAERRMLLKSAWAENESGKEKVRVAVTAAWTPERRAKQAASRTAAWADPEFKKRVSANIRSAKKVRKAINDS